MAQLVEQLTLGFGSGHDPRVMGSSPASGFALNREPPWDSLSPSLSLSLSALPLLAVSLMHSKIINIKRIFFLKKRGRKGGREREKGRFLFSTWRNSLSLGSSGDSHQ